MNKPFTLAVALAAGLTFSLAHADGDKGKPHPEHKKGRHGDPAKRAEMLIKKLDKDGDKKLSKVEFAAGPMAEKIKKEHGEEGIDKVFKARDENGDGFLDHKELAKPPKHRKGPRPEGKGKPKKKAEGDKKE